MSNSWMLPNNIVSASGALETEIESGGGGSVETSGGSVESGSEGGAENVGNEVGNENVGEVEIPNPPENETIEDLTDYLARLNEIYEALKAKEQELEINVIKQDIEIKKAQIREIQKTYKIQQDYKKKLLSDSKALSDEIDLLKTLKPTLEDSQIQARIYLIIERLESLKGQIL